MSCTVAWPVLLCCLFAVAFTVRIEAYEPEQPVTCPGVRSQHCTPACQVAVCKALAQFYAATYNASQAWQHNLGWNLTTLRSCESIVHANPVPASPPYCSWNGVGCCMHHPLDPDDEEERACSIIHSVRALDLQVNGLNGSVDNPEFMQALLQLHACGVTKVQLQGNELTGALRSPSWGLLTNLTYLDLANNWLTGTIPASFRHLSHLKRLSLGTNQLHGPLPGWLGQLTNLETLNLGANTGVNPESSDKDQGLTGTIPESVAELGSLTVLNLELNTLVGALPPKLCHPGSQLRALKLRGNRLSGGIEQLTDCESLTQLDISSNNFSGPLAISSSMAWPQLAVLDASNNRFEGSIPIELYQLPVLEYLNLANNRFCGPITRHISLTTYLKELNLEYNQLTGPIDENLWLLRHLRLLDLSHNRLTGTISEAVGRTLNLEELQLSSNNLSGPVPPTIGFLKKIDVVNLSKNPQLTCLPPSSNSSSSTGSNTGNRDAAAAFLTSPPLQHCNDSQLLPCFLYFSNYTLPRMDDSKMACPAVLRRRYAEAARVCAGEAPSQLGKNSHSVADAIADAQNWKFEPGYYQYKGCVCLSGYVPQWSDNDTKLSCSAQQPTTDPGWVRGLIQAMSILGAMLLTAVILMALLRMAVQLRPRWQREKELNENRKKGMPSGAPATIVVTDIEKYSELMQSNAPLATKALGIHNTILRRAAAAHAGHVVEQEGDSWSVAFHTPMDAVAFCLQVQQALDRTNWPRDLGARTTTTSKHTSCDTEAPLDAPPAAATAGCCGIPAGHHPPQYHHSQQQQHHHHYQQQHYHRQLSSPWPEPPSGRGSCNNSATNQGPAGVQLLQPNAAAAAGCGPASSGLEAACLAAAQQAGQPHTEEAVAAAAAAAAWPAGSSCRSHTATLDGDLPPSTPHESPFAAVVATSASSITSRRSSSSSSLGQDMDKHSSRYAAGHGAGRVCASGVQRYDDTVSNNSRYNNGSPRAAATMAGLQCNRSSSSFNSGIMMCESSSTTAITGPDSCAAAWGVHGCTSSLSAPKLRRNSGGSKTARFWSIIGLNNAGGLSSRGQVESHMLGLRVRMGVASGMVPANTRIERCALLELAKAVSDLANGGQILLESGCFSGVRDRLTELGGVDHRGYNDTTLAHAARAAMRQQTSGLLCNCLGRLRLCLGRWPDTHVDSDALLLDMGQYYLANLAPVIPAAASGSTDGGSAAAAASSGGSTSTITTSPGLSILAAAGPGNAALAAAAAASSSNSSLASTMPQALQLYSILPRSLSCRAKQWGNRLNCKEGMQLTARGYFEAPGTEVAELQPSPAAFPGPFRSPLPSVTMVFAAVDGGRGRVHRRHEVARIVHNTLSRLMQALLLSLPERQGCRPDGYLCRQQEGELKYMLAFREPARALEWCLLLQEVLLHVPWPQVVLDAFEATCISPTATAADGRLSGNGLPHGSSGSSVGGGRPLLNIGLADGQPHSIAPDHLGRADYHGPSVNLAARMMAAAAGGGQVVTSSELAQSIFSTWCYEAELEKCHHQMPTATAAAPKLLQLDAAPPPAAKAAAQMRSAEEQLSAKVFGLLPLRRSSSGGVALSAPPTGALQQQQQQQQQEPDKFREQDQQQQQQPMVAALDPLAASRLTVCSSSNGVNSCSTAVLSSSCPQQLLFGQGSLNGSLLPSTSSSPIKLQAHRQPKSDCCLLPGPEYPQHTVHVSGWHIGTFTFKGCGTLDMVTFVTDSCRSSGMGSALLHCAAVTTPRHSKGTLLLPRSGPVIGLQHCPVQLPDVLPILQKAWTAAADAAAEAEHAKALRRQTRASDSSCSSSSAQGDSSHQLYAQFCEAPDIVRSKPGSFANLAAAGQGQTRLVLLPPASEQLDSSCGCSSGDGSGVMPSDLRQPL